METVICPNCGHEISVPKRKVSSIKCQNCDMDGLELGLDYFDETDTPKESFLKRHPKVVAAGLFAIGLAGKGLIWWLDHKDEFSSGPVLEVDSYNESLTESMPLETDSDTISEKPEAHMNLDDYDAKIVNHPMVVRNLSEDRFPSLEKKKQARDLGIELGLHQTIVDSYPQRHYTKKTE